MQKACMNGSNNITECTCNNVMYNVCAACALCQGDSAEDWNGWASSVGCTGQPLAFPSNIGLSQGTLPKWAQLPLTANQDFDVAEAVRVGSTLPGVSKSSVAVQVAVPIATAVGVAVFAVVTFWLCWRRKWRKYRDPRPSETACTTSPSWAWIHKVYPFEHAKRLRPCNKNSDWAIDEDRQWLGHRRGQSSASYIDPYVLAQSPVQEEPLGLDVPHTSAHIKETSSTSLLPHLPEVHVPTFMERLVNFKDGLRKSPSYKVKHVSPVSPDAQFRIDGYSGDTPVKPGFARANRELSLRQLPSVGPGAGTGVGGRTNGSIGPSGSNAAQDAQTEHSDFGSQPGGVGSSVLLISRDGEDFSLEDYATTAADHSQATTPRTPNTFRTVGDASAVSDRCCIRCRLLQQY
ncbi:hypothetical protein BD413DRAFT_218535 [Trametes elegans]|nr:hypothetical protein BD413DRAFT_218535 [Trametes elegans]